MSKADKLQTIANNLATESKTVKQQTELLQQIRTALGGKTVPGDPGDSGSYDEGYADGYEEGQASYNERDAYIVSSTNSELESIGVGTIEGVLEIPSKIDEVYDKGGADGYTKGHTDGVTDGIEQGKAEAIDSLPGGYIKIDPTWTSWYMLCNGRPSIVPNLKYSDSSNVTNFNGAFQACNVKSIPRLDFRKAQSISSLCIYSSMIEEVGEMEIPNVTNADYAFSGCTGLKRITFVPNCIKAPIGFANSNLLDDASIQSIIDGLADLTGKTAQTLTLHATVGGKLTQAQKDAISAKNWTLAY